MRKHCLQCFRKHLGNAQVLLEEVADGYPYWMGVVGHLDQAAQEIRGYSEELAKVVRAHRIKMQNSDEFWKYDIPFEAIDSFIRDIENNPALLDDFPEIPEECYAGLDTRPDGSYQLYEGDQR